MPGSLDHDDLTPRVGALETGFAEMRALLGAVGVTLAEIKATINNARPAWHVVAPIALTFILMIAGGVAALYSVKGEIASLRTLKDARDTQFEAVDRRLAVLEQRQWEELKGERDHLRQAK